MAKKNGHDSEPKLWFEIGKVTMEIEKYVPNSLSVGAILGLIEGGEIAIPEIQRPFVWKKTQIRDLEKRRVLMAKKIKKYYESL